MHLSSTIIVVGHGELYLEMKSLYRESFNLIFAAKSGKALTIKQHNKLLSDLITTSNIFDTLALIEERSDTVNIAHRPPNYELREMEDMDLSRLEGPEAWMIYKHKITASEEMFKKIHNPAYLPNHYDHNYLPYNIKNYASSDPVSLSSELAPQLPWKIYIHSKKLKILLDHPDSDVILNTIYYLTPLDLPYSKPSMKINEVFHMIYNIKILCDKASDNPVRVVYLEEAEMDSKIQKIYDNCKDPQVLKIAPDANLFWATCRLPGNIWEYYSLPTIFANYDIETFTKHSTEAEPYMLSGYTGYLYDL